MFDIDFSQPLRILGFYNNPNQILHPESKYVSECEKLSIKLEKSFNSLLSNPNIDSLFRSIISSNAVFILKNKRNILVAYSPSTKISRISNVVYNKEAITSAPYPYKAWFIPGENIDINQKVNKVNNEHADNKKHNFIIGTSGSDFLITYNNRTLPLNISEDKYISIGNLRNLLNHDWVCLCTYNTSLDCEGCDGYDYSYCDMDRCKNDCDSCGGRRYICNNGCFNHRYGEAIKLVSYDDKILAEIAKVEPILDQIIKPHSNNAQKLYSLHVNEFDKVQTKGYEIHDYVSLPSVFWDYNSKLKMCKVLQQMRAHPSITFVRILNYYVDFENIEFIEDSFLFFFCKSWYIHTKEFCYDVNQDKFVKFNIKLEFPNKAVRKDLENAFQNKRTSIITDIVNKYGRNI